MMTGNRALKILEWAKGTLKYANPDKLTAFERELLAKCNEIEINIPGFGRVPAIRVADIIPKTRLILDDGRVCTAKVWEVESISKIENGLLELVLVQYPRRQIIRKRPTTLMGYIKGQ